MIFTISFLVFSFLFQGFISNYQNFTLLNPSLFSTIYVLITLIILGKYFYNDKKYLITAFIAGFMYDIVYTNTFILNAVLFLAIVIAVKFIFTIFSDNVINFNIISLVSITLYHILSYIILLVIDYNNYNLFLLGKIILGSMIMTIIYTTIIYYLTDYIFKMFDLKPIR